jgi:hypothetical protein
MPKFPENKLKAEYGSKSKIPFKVMNAIGAMRGNQETAKGAQMEAKHKLKSEGHEYDSRRPRKPVRSRYSG